MIFATVGEQLPFERLIKAVDALAPNIDHDIFAQIGNSKFRPLNIKYKRFLGPDEFVEKFLRADVIIAHAGMGTIITALEYGKPTLIMPRKAILGEHRNDHQFATSKRFAEYKYISVVFDAHELEARLNSLLNSKNQQAQKSDVIAPSSLLIDRIRDFVLSN